jgi:hypothetical protein
MKISELLAAAQGHPTFDAGTFYTDAAEGLAERARALGLLVELLDPDARDEEP